MDLGALGGGSGSHREIQSTDTDGTLQQYVSCDPDLSSTSSIISVSKLIHNPMSFGMNLNNGASSGQSRKSSGQNWTLGGKPRAINTTLDVPSNIEHGVTPKISNASPPPGTSTAEIMALLEQKSLLTERKCLDAMQQFTEEMDPFAYSRIVGVPNTKKGLDHYTIEYDKAKLNENKSCEFYTT
eukprot:8849433-Ditylum_brightwellii.AAC.1